MASMCCRRYASGRSTSVAVRPLDVADVRTRRELANQFGRPVGIRAPVAAVAGDAYPAVAPDFNALRAQGEATCRQKVEQIHRMQAPGGKADGDRAAPAGDDCAFRVFYDP